MTCVPASFAYQWIPGVVLDPVRSGADLGWAEVCAQRGTVMTALAARAVVLGPRTASRAVGCRMKLWPGTCFAVSSLRSGH